MAHLTTQVRTVRQPIHEWMALLLMVIITIAWAFTTLESRGLLETMRVGAVALLGICLLWQLFRVRVVQRRVLIGLALVAVIVLYGFIVGLLNGVRDQVTQQALVNVVLIALLVSALIASRGSLLSRRVVWAYLSVVGVVFVASMVSGGFTLTYPPAFHFETLRDESIRSLAYSQGSSKFYGLSAILASFLFTRATTAPQALATLAITVAALALSAIAGGRGDFLAAAAIVSGLLLYRRTYVGAAIGVSAAVFVLLADFVALRDGFVIVRRLELLSQSLGLRDVLAAQSLELLEQRPLCMAIGCGFGYFQHHHGYGPGTYPHNLLLESVIVFGLPLTLISLLGAAVGFLQLTRRGSSVEPFMLVLAFFGLIGLKSGTLLSSWIVLSGLVFLVVEALEGGHVTSQGGTRSWSDTTAQAHSSRTRADL